MEINFEEALREVPTLAIADIILKVGRDGKPQTVVAGGLNFTVRPARPDEEPTCTLGKDPIATAVIAANKVLKEGLH